MIKVTLIPDDINIEVNEGARILDVLKKAGIYIDIPCGGEGTCGKCKVLIVEGIPPASAIEKSFLTKREIEEGYRLACQAKLTQDAIIEIPLEVRLNIEKSFFAKAKGDISGTKKCFPLDTGLFKIFIELEKPSLADQRSDWERIKDGISLYGKHMKDPTILSNLSLPLEILKRIPVLIREADFKITITILNNEVINIEKGDTTKDIYGIAFDIGTTTAAGYLVNLINGKEIASVARLNPQVKYGDDIISRIGFVQKSENGLQILQEEIVGAVNEIISELTYCAKIDRDDIYKIVFVGNTCMHHLLLGITPVFLAPSPYLPAVRESISLKVKDIPGLFLNETTEVFLLPNISAFVGADISAGIIANNIWKKDKNVLFVDLGTNGEIVLGVKGELWACSTAVGPAFEGARISSGMRAAKGAIDRVKIKNDSIFYRVIENGKVRGLCGAGIIDIIAELLKLGIIERSGKLLGRLECSPRGSDGIKKRILKNKNGNRFLLIEGERTVSGEAIYLTQKDIREVQLAKAAVSAGIKIILKEANIGEGDIEEILLAGAFGNFIDKKNAVKIGLIPGLPLNRIKSVGNSAGKGAELALSSNMKRQLCEEISKKVNYIELSSNPDFQREYIDELFFN